MGLLTRRTAIRVGLGAGLTFGTSAGVAMAKNVLIRRPSPIMTSGNCPMRNGRSACRAKPMRFCARKRQNVLGRARSMMKSATAFMPVQAAVMSCSPQIQNMKAAPAGQAFGTICPMPLAKNATSNLSFRVPSTIAHAAAAIRDMSLVTVRIQRVCVIAIMASPSPFGRLNRL